MPFTESSPRDPAALSLARVQHGQLGSVSDFTQMLLGFP